MTPEQLLNPRFKVIADYPKCQFIVGDILQRINGATNDIFHSDSKARNGGINLNELSLFQINIS